MHKKEPWACSHASQLLACAVAALLAFAKTLPPGGPPCRQTGEYEMAKTSSRELEAIDFRAEGRIAKALPAWQQLPADNPAHGLVHVRLPAQAVAVQRL